MQGKCFQRPYVTLSHGLKSKRWQTLCVNKTSLGHSSSRCNELQCKEYFLLTLRFIFSNINHLITFRNFTKMHVFFRYYLWKPYCENFFVTLFYNWQSKLFIRFVYKKNMRKCSIRYVVLKCSIRYVVLKCSGLNVFTLHIVNSIVSIKNVTRYFPR